MFSVAAFHAPVLFPTFSSPCFFLVSFGLLFIIRCLFLFISATVSSNFSSPGHSGINVVAEEKSSGTAKLLQLQSVFLPKGGLWDTHIMFDLIQFSIHDTRCSSECHSHSATAERNPTHCFQRGSFSPFPFKMATHCLSVKLQVDCDKGGSECTIHTTACS